MKTIVIGSLNKGAGKTSIIIGIAKNLGKKIGYMKPFGDRLLYKKKRLWDYDSALITNVIKLNESPEEMSIGFEHAKLRYMYDDESIKTKLKDLAGHNGKGKDVLFVESSGTLSLGISVNLDVLSVTKNLGAELVLVISGDEDSIIDKITFLKNSVDISKIKFMGIIINKVRDVEDFRHAYQPSIEELGIKVLGVVPYSEKLKYFSAGYLSDALFARVIAGETGLGKIVKKVFVGAMTVDAVLKMHDFKKEERKLVITSGDRSDMILAAIETGASAIVVTNNILPEPNIMSKATEGGVPMLLVASDTYQVAKQIDELEALTTKEDKDKIELLAELVKENVDLESL